MLTSSTLLLISDLILMMLTELSSLTSSFFLSLIINGSFFLKLYLSATINPITVAVFPLPTESLNIPPFILILLSYLNFNCSYV